MISIESYFYMIIRSQLRFRLFFWVFSAFFMSHVCLVPWVYSQTLTPRSAAQKDFDATGWSDQFALPGVYGTVRSVAVHGEYVYIGGDFLSGGDAISQSIVRWNRATGTWSSLDGGVDGLVYALAVADDGAVYVGGDFSMAGSTPAKNIARWDGETWSPLGEGADGLVEALAVDGRKVYAAGEFLTASGITVNRIAQWDGSIWHSLGKGIEGDYVAAIAVDEDGTVYVGGRFSQAGGGVANNVAGWNGSEWFGLGKGTDGSVFDGAVAALAVDGTTLYAGGVFTSAGGIAATLAAQWDGAQWHDMGDDFSQGIAAIETIAVDEQGKVYVGGELQNTFPTNAAVWDGTAWTPLEHPFIFEILTLAASGSEIYLGGTSPFIPEGGNLVNQLYRYDGERWSVLGNPATNGLTNHVNALIHESGAGSMLYAAGNFEFASTARANGVARWDGTSWVPLDSGLDGSFGFAAEALVLAPDGTLYVGGDFEQVGSVQARNIAAWNEDRWEVLDGGLNGRVEALVLKEDTLYAGGWFTQAYNETDSVSVGFIARWDGHTWSSVGSGVNGPVSAMALSEQGDLLVGGHFTEAGGAEAQRIARWDGHTWSRLGGGMDFPVFALAARGGEVYAGGNFITAGNGFALHVARWGGQRWEALGEGVNGDVHDLTFSQRGDLYVAGDFGTAGGGPASNVARWDGTQWHALDGGVYGFMARAITTDDGAVYVGGEFSSAGDWIFNGGLPASNFAVWHIPFDLPVEKEEPLSAFLELHQNYPNPFRRTTTITYRLERPRHVRLKVYDVLGREVATLVNARRAPGTHLVDFDAQDLPTGVYICTLSTDQAVQTRRMTHIR